MTLQAVYSPHPSVGVTGVTAGGRRLRILHCIPHLSRGGAERQFSYLAAEQQQRGHDVHVAYLSEGTESARLRSMGIALHRIVARGNYDPTILRAIHRLVRTLAPDVLQSWVTQMDVLAGLCARGNRVAWVLREPASAEHYVGWKAGLRAFLARGATAIVANSATGAGYWQRRRQRVGVRVVRNGIPFQEIEAAPPRGWRDAAGTEVPFLLFAGRLEPQKNLELLLRAFSRVPAPVHAVWCGEGSLRMQLEALAVGLGIADRVAFLGQQPAEIVWGLMKAARALTFVSRYEGLPNVVLEAIACRCPLVLSDIPMHREILSEAEFVPLDDDRHVADGINNVLRHPERARARAEHALNHVAEWSIPRMADAYDEIYRSAIAGLRAGMLGEWTH